WRRHPQTGAHFVGDLLELRQLNPALGLLADAVKPDFEAGALGLAHLTFVEDLAEIVALALEPGLHDRDIDVLAERRVDNTVDPGLNCARLHSEPGPGQGVFNRVVCSAIEDRRYR